MVTILLCILSMGYAKNYTVSGLGSGAFMANQLHIAYSSFVMGAGLIGGGPYHCTLDSRVYAESICRRHADLIKDESIYQYITELAGKGMIDPISNLDKSSVYIFGGALDTEFYPAVVKKTEELYKLLIKNGTIITNYEVQAQHAWITSATGNQCDYLGIPYVNFCDLDLAGEFMKMFDTGAMKGTANNTNIKTFSQTSFTDIIAAGLDSQGYAYVPTNCTDTCSVHVALHGCYQEETNVDMTFIKENGLNDWAEGSDVIVLYPQIRKDSTNNPMSCWDFWGYTGANYTVKNGVQMQAVHNMTQNIAVILSESYN